MTRHPKLRLRISPTCVNSQTIFDTVSTKYDIVYCGIHMIGEDVYVYLHHQNRMSHKNLRKLLEGFLKISEISNFASLDGTILEYTGKILKHGGHKKSKKRKAEEDAIGTTKNVTNNISNISNITNNDNSVTTNNNNINVIIVNPIGQESLEHITPEFIQELLAEHHGPDVVFRFGTKMYSLQENMNFKTDLKSGYISGRVEHDGAWETHRKNDGFYMLMDNLKDKNEQAVLQHLEEIPDEDLEKFKLDMGWIREHKISGLQEDEPVYNKFIREGFNLLTANIADKVRRIERDTGKKLKLV